MKLVLIMTIILATYSLAVASERRRLKRRVNSQILIIEKIEEILKEVENAKGNFDTSIISSLRDLKKRYNEWKRTLPDSTPQNEIAEHKKFYTEEVTDRLRSLQGLVAAGLLETSNAKLSGNIETYLKNYGNAKTVTKGF